MNPELSVQGIEDVEQLLRVLKTEFPREAAQALNTARTATRTAARRAFQETTSYRGSVRALNRRLLNGKRATSRNLESKIRVKDTRIQAKFFRVIEHEGRGLTLIANQGDPRRIRHGFHQGATRAQYFVRERGAGRYPIRAVLGPSPADVLDRNPLMGKRIEERAAAVVKRETLRRMNRLIG